MSACKICSHLNIVCVCVCVSYSAIASCLFTLYTDQYGPVVTCLTQLFGNICVSNDSSQGEVWYALYPIAFK